MKRTFFICPVRGHRKEETEAILRKLERENWEVHWPHRDTDQNDDIGFRICRDNRKAIRNCDAVHIVWDGVSQGCLFDLGMAFMAELPIYVVHLPDPTEGKSFQNMIREWERLSRKWSMSKAERALIHHVEVEG